MKLYEEADQLIASCNQKLTTAEQKIEVLMKNRSGEVAVDENGKPLTEPFILK
ncbi:MAG TPA: exodeoxyribonuclease VII small subunit [Rhabdochlamydiaceae bacterium]|nr:exodeoxyribonuclease VII small subunit [Rhabdochlamydiaceae bacterium]